MAEHIQKGRLGEELAGKYLAAKGFRILESNYRYSRAEIDLIAQHGDQMVFVEVKTRSGNYSGDPESSVGNRKEEMMAMAADHYMNENDLETEVRFDIVSILLKTGGHEIHHIEDAFFPYDMDLETE